MVLAYGAADTNGKVAVTYINIVFIISSFHTACPCLYIGR